MFFRLNLRGHLKLYDLLYDKTCERLTILRTWFVENVVAGKKGHYLWHPVGFLRTLPNVL